MDFIMTCSTANTILVARVHLAFTVLEIAPFAITFYLYIYLSPVYLSEFWNSSPIGKCLMKAKKKLPTGGAESAAGMVEFAPTEKFFSKLPQLEKRQNRPSRRNAPKISPHARGHTRVDSAPLLQTVYKSSIINNNNVLDAHV
jgi:hypothetical protein